MEKSRLFSTLRLSTIFFLVLFGGSSLRAEYQNLYITFTAVNGENDLVKGYVSAPSHFISDDLLNNKTDLIKALDLLDDQEDDYLVYGLNLIAYHFYYPESNEPNTVYTLIDTQRVKLSTLTDVKIQSWFHYSYLTSVSNINSTADTLWAYTKPVKAANFSGYFCSWNIYVHEASARVDGILAELQKHEEVIRNLEQTLNMLNAQGESEAKTDAENEMNAMEETIDETLGLLIKKLMGERVVVVSFCSC